MLNYIGSRGVLMNNIIESIDHLTSYCADDKTLLRAWEVRISFAFIYLASMYLGLFDKQSKLQRLFTFHPDVLWLICFGSNGIRNTGILSRAG